MSKQQSSMWRDLFEPGWRERAFVQAWAAYNIRSGGVNHGLRAIEYMLARQHPIENRVFRNVVNRKAVPNVSMDDFDVVESMVRWWASSDAALMREIAEPAILSAERRLLSGIFSSAAPAAKGEKL